MHCYLCVYVLTVDDLLFDNQLVCSCLGNTISSSLSIPYLLVVICVDLRPLSFPLSTLLCVFLSSLFGSYLGTHVGEMGVASDIPRKHMLKVNSVFRQSFQ